MMNAKTTAVRDESFQSRPNWPDGTARCNQIPTKRRTRHPILERLLLLVIGIGFDALLLAYYETSLVDRHGYEGIVMRPVSVSCWTAAWGMSLLPLLWLPIRFRIPSDFCVWCLYLTLIAPGPFVALMVSHGRPTDVLVFQFVVLISFSLLELRRGGWLTHALRVVGTGQYVRYGIPILLISLAVFVLGLNGFRVNVSFADVYARRTLASELVGRSTFESYIVAAMTKALIPITIAVGVTCKKYLHVAAGVFASVVVFSLDGTKITMVLPLLLVCVLRLAARPKARHGMVLLLGGYVMIAAASLESRIAGTYVLNDFAVRRTLVTPSQLSTYYCEYFSKNPHLYFRDGLLGSLLGDPHPVSAASQIGYEYFGSEEIIANSGIWATAYAHVGFVAMPIVGLLAAWLLGVIDRMASVRSYVVGSGIAFVIGLTWAEKAFHTSLLTGGVVWLLLLLYLLPDLGSSFSSLKKFTPRASSFCRQLQAFPRLNLIGHGRTKQSGQTSHLGSFCLAQTPLIPPPQNTHQDPA